MRIELPDPCLVVLVGTTGAGKSTFAARHFRPTEVLSSDFFRGLVADDQNDQAATGDAFDVLHLVASRRLAARRLTVVDATNVLESARAPLLAIAGRSRLPAIAIVLDTPKGVCEERNRARPDRRDLGRVLARQHAALRRSIGRLDEEGFARVWIVGQTEMESIQVVRQRSDRRP
jgi:predicted kinase